ncbi:hypothetical protein HMPREF1554_00861 [Porphyromonas gingivalis F0569]|nr:hypothetical protein HMPREF1554_00861 [Porphyromonas gingivalis F0569]
MFLYESDQKCKKERYKPRFRPRKCHCSVGNLHLGHEMQNSHRTVLLPLGHRPKTQAIVLKKKYICLRLSHSAFRIIRVKKNFLHNT